jgi:hypothetical protein
MTGTLSVTRGLCGKWPNFQKSSQNLADTKISKISSSEILRLFESLKLQHQMSLQSSKSLQQTIY